jgi:hypothetical protein
MADATKMNNEDFVATERELERMQAHDNVLSQGWGRRATDARPAPQYQAYASAGRYGPERPTRVVSIIQPRKAPGNATVQFGSEIDAEVAANFRNYAKMRGLKLKSCVEDALRSWLESRR